MGGEFVLIGSICRFPFGDLRVYLRQMHWSVKNILGLILALLIAVTSTSMAVARGQMYDATGAIVLCTGTGPITVLVDHGGQPVEQAPICPDCAFSLLEYVAATDEISLPIPSEFVAYFEFEITNWLGHSLSRARVRGPPSA